MTEAAEHSPEIALLFPPLFFNHFHGPYLSLPHLAAFLESEGVTVSMHDVNSRALDALTSADFLALVLREIEKNLASAQDEETRKHLLHNKCVLNYFHQDTSRFFADDSNYRMLCSILHDFYYSKLTKDLPSQIGMVGQETGMEPLQAVVGEAIAELPESTRIVGISLPTVDQFFPALLLARQAKARFGDAVHVVFGGCIFSFMDDGELAAILAEPFVDSIVLHEGERSLLALHGYLQGQLPLDQVPNLCYRKEGRLQKTDILQAILLDDCPPPLFRQNYIEKYRAPLNLPLWASRGCYWGKCTFCDYVHISCNRNRVETIQVARLLDNMQALEATLGVRRFELIAECLSPSFCEALAAGIVERGMRISWRGLIRVEQSFSKRLCQQMALSGCTEVHIGVESFCERQLALMCKGYSRNDAIAMLSNLKEAGIRTTINIIIDFPGVTVEEMEETLRFLEEYRNAYDELTVFPFLLSRLSEVAKNPGRYGITLTHRPDLDHCRGFHYLEFERQEGARGNDQKVMTERYAAFSQMYRRRRIIEASMDELRNGSFLSLLVRPQPRFYFPAGEEAQEIVRILHMEQLRHNESLVFDLDCKLINKCPDALVQLYKVLPASTVPVSAIVKAIEVGDRTAAEKEALIRDLILYGVAVGLLAVGPASSDSGVGNAVRRTASTNTVITT